MDTLFTGQNSIELESVDSTNSYASESLKTTALPEGTMIITQQQKAGKGQRGNKWFTEAGKNITCSFIFYPSFLVVEKQFMLTKVVSLAVVDTLMELVDPKAIKIKWPNDIYVDDKKIAGILIENSLKQNSIGASIFGIGMNVNQEKFVTEAGNATSMKIISGKEFVLKVVIEKLCSFLEARYLQLRSDKNEILDSDYLKLLYRMNEWANYSISTLITEGKIIGVSETGKLKIEFRTGEKKEFDLKEIAFI